MKRFGAMASMLLLCTTLAGAAPTAESVLQSARERVASMQDYTLEWDASGGRGAFQFDYRCVRPAEIRTHIISGAHAGATLLYSGRTEPTRVRAHQGIFTVWKRADDPEFRDSCLTRSVLDYAISDGAGGTPTLAGTEVVSGHACYHVTFNNPGQTQLWIDTASFDILQWVDVRDGRSLLSRFYDIRVNTSPSMSL